MSRFITALVVCILVLASTTASAQDLPMPGRGEILELRRNDPRYEDGHRSFIFGSYVPGMPSLEDTLDRVNADLGDGPRVTFDQVDTANPCLIIYHRASGGNRHNGSCDTNPTAERVTYASFCGAPGACDRWSMAGRVYRIPSTPRLTPGERAEEMVHRLDETTVTETVPAPAELGGWLSELSDNMGEEQPPTYGQVRDVIAAVGRTLMRAETGSTGTASDEGTEPVGAHSTTMTFSEDDVPEAPTETAISPRTGVEGEEEPAPSTLDEVTTFLLTNPYFLWSIIASLSLALIIFLLKDNIRSWFRPTKNTEQQQPDSEAQPLPPVPSEDVQRGRQVKELFKEYGLGALTETALDLFFMTADSDKKLVAQQKEKIDALGVAKTSLPLPDPRLETLERELGSANAGKRDLEGKLRSAEQAKAQAEASALSMGIAHSEALRQKDDAHELTKKALEVLQKEYDEFKAKGLALVELFYQDGVANLDLALDHASRSGEISTPSFVTIIERISSARDLFKDIIGGVFNDLMIHFESELAMVPATVGVSGGVNPFAATEKQVPGRARTNDSWESEEELPELRTNASLAMPTFSREEPSSVPPQPGALSVFPPAEKLALAGETTNPGVKMPEAPPELSPHPAVPPPPPLPADEAGEDNEAFRPSRHAPPMPARTDETLPTTGRKTKRRKRINTQPIEKPAPRREERVIASPRNDEKTAVIDQEDLERKKVEARTGKTTTPGGMAAATYDGPVPGSQPPPPPASDGEESDPTEVGSRKDLPAAEGPASLSIFDNLDGPSETGVTIKKVVGES